jgi:hypothetical protein
MTSTVQAPSAHGEGPGADGVVPPPRRRLYRLRLQPIGAAARLRRNWLIALLLLVGGLLRLAAWLAYQPGLLYIDSFRYLDNLSSMDPDQLDPIGYDLLLHVLLPFGGLTTVAAVQHLAGLGMGVAIYTLLLRHGARRWLAAVGAAPVLLDAYQVQIEQNIMSDVWLEVLALAALWLLVARAGPTPRRAAWAGVAVGFATIVRTIALPMALPIMLFLLVAGGAWRNRAGWRRAGRRLGAFFAGLVLVVFGYACYFHVYTGGWGLTGSSGSVTYGRTAEVADCSTLKLPAELAELCPTEPLDARMGVDWYAHLDGSGHWPQVVPPGMSVVTMQNEFAKAVLTQQPLRVINSVLVDFGKGFAPGKQDTAATAQVPVTRWQFQTTYWLYEPSATTWQYTMTYGGLPPTVNVSLASLLRSYQLHGGYTQGPVLALFAVLGLIGGFGIGRRRSGIRAATLVTTTLGLTLLFGSAMFEFSWRYQLPGLVLLPLGGVLGLTALIGPTSRPAPAPARRRRLGGFPDQVDWEAVTEFTARYGQPTFAPVLVVIAAYNEEDGIGGVLDRLPTTCCELGVDVLVVVDGCTDGTAAAAMEHGAYVCVAPKNRGQGAALRLGYQLAAYGGAQYVITTDADGQYENDEMPLLLRPLLEDTADFVTGSRRLGVEDTDDRVRSVGVRFFATLASLLTLRKITDTSFGFRAMRTELAGSIRLRQPQYQASELLLGALAGGARLLEMPMTMRVRTAGSTKKGNNFAYGYNYAKAMTGTWLREFVVFRLVRLVRPGSRTEQPSERQVPDSAART